RQGGSLHRTDARLSDRFVSFLNRLVQITQAIYPDGRDPGFSFGVRAQPSRDVPQIILTVDNQTARWTTGEAASLILAWNGLTAQQAVLKAQYGASEMTMQWPPEIGPVRTSPWALFHVFWHASKQRQPTSDLYEWPVSGERLAGSRGQVARIQGERGRDALSRDLFGD